MKLVFATHNENKFREVKAQMPDHVELLSLSDINCFDDIAETEKTIEGNALLKARYVKDHFGIDCFADDSGLEVAALNNAPGVYSARYAGPEKNADSNNRKLLEALQKETNRAARFKTVIALIMNGEEHLFTGLCPGRIIEAPRGEGGFGYDPIFQPDGFEKTFAEMSLSRKTEIGHRGNAIRQLITYLRM
ncbi:MAG: non-canonical purine NTP diphosphatase [Bacteroidia bacterium]|nr:non-canonical purine NTP diphosphatase [Bacteroidia bacterium]NNF31207.1 non-canonical purine NTP diphosphatase [Flavobacteriaceae bacterium]MBT8274800.1 non-canonical purine NTP diphosphatase [Bacteroidia bacterium]NNJ82511.1 non-canonical purine NTP diphosphatase [Flavobacteriaceae bacterium]NNK54637.1 non-canonical purine NTP diphosphatase [Flavobacteriaceae bacterium]